MSEQLQSRRTPRLQNRQLRFLAGIGLVVVGLLCGILIMLLVQEPRELGPRTEFRLVDRAGILDSTGSGPDSVQQRELTGALELSKVFRNVAHRAVASVVSIEAGGDWRPMFWRRSEGGESFRESAGSGVVITPQGHIVTNYHLIRDASTLRVVFEDKSEYEAYVVGVDQSTDLAVIRIELELDHEVPAIVLGDSDEIQPGDWVLAVGNPLQLTSTVTAGIVSALGRAMQVIDEEISVEDFIQTDAAINPGNSGGALVNLRGELVGINTAIATNSGYYEGYGFAIPVNLVMRIAVDLIDYGEVQRGFMGVELGNVDAQLAKSLSLDGVNGVFVHKVVSGGAAERGGLRAGDVILALDGRRVNETNKLQSAVAFYRPGERVSLSIWRDGNAQELELELLGKNNPGVAKWLSSLGRQWEGRAETALYFPEWGLGLRDMQVRDEAHFKGKSGVIIDRVTHSRTGDSLRAGLLIERINGKAVYSIQDAAALLADATQDISLSLLDLKQEPQEVRLSAPGR